MVIYIYIYYIYIYIYPAGGFVDPRAHASPVWSQEQSHASFDSNHIVVLFLQKQLVLNLDRICFWKNYYIVIYLIFKTTMTQNYVYTNPFLHTRIAVYITLHDCLATSGTRSRGRFINRKKWGFPKTNNS